MLEILFDIIGAFVDPILGVIGLLFKYILLPALGIVVACGVLYALVRAIKNVISPPPPPPKKALPPNLGNYTKSEKQCKDCLYCGRNESESGEGLAHLCTKYQTTVSKYDVCDDFTSYIDVALGINRRK